MKRPPRGILAGRPGKNKKLFVIRVVTQNLAETNFAYLLTIQMYRIYVESGDYQHG